MKRDPPTRTLVAVLIGLGAGTLCYWHLHVLEPETLGFDFTWPWRAARALLAGQNPYTVIRPTGPFPFDAYFKYPLPAALIAIPFAWMRPDAAAAAFSGLSAAMLAFGLTRDTWGRLYLLASAPFVVTVLSGQWSSLLMAAALLPSLSWIAVCKPNIGVAVFAYRPNWRAVIGGTLLLVISLCVAPAWPRDWIASIRLDPAQHYLAPITLFGGPLLALALLEWRHPDARYLLGVAIAPQVLGFYTAFLPMLVARARMESLILALTSTLAWSGYTWALHGQPGETGAPLYAGHWILWLVFIPALAVVLRPNRHGAESE